MFALIQLIVLFTVLFDPPASLAVFFSATQKMSEIEKKKTAAFAVLTAAILSFGTLLLGEYMLLLFNTTINDFRVAGGIILLILGVRMTLGYPLANIDMNKEEKSVHAIAALIATPLLTGPAVITSIVVLRNDFGFIPTAFAIAVVLVLTWLLLHNTVRVYKLLGTKIPQIISTFLGLITIAWGIGFLRTAFGL